MAKKPESSGPRGRLSDLLQSHSFWAFDASADLAVPVFNPLFGFARISAPEIVAEVETFKDGTNLYPRHQIKGGTVGSILFERGASMFDADFYTWIIHAIHGNKDFEDGGTLGKIANFIAGGARTSPRRNLLIVQFAGIDISPPSLFEDGDTVGKVAGAAVGVIGAAAIGSIFGGGGTVTAAVGATLLTAGLGPFKFANRLPARAWLLHECLPIRYRPGSDFDAFSGEVSMQELEVQPEYVEEFSLGLKP